MAPSTATKGQTTHTHESENGNSASHPLLVKRAELIAAYESEHQQALVAGQLGDKKEQASHDAKKSNRSREIRETELEIASVAVEAKEAGENDLVLLLTVEPWNQPRKSGSSKAKKTTRTKLAIEEDLARVARVYNGEFPQPTKDTAGKRISSLMREATSAGYDITDPRPAEVVEAEKAAAEQRAANKAAKATAAAE